MTGLAQEHISVTKGSEESPAQVHKQSLNLCGTVFLSTSLSQCVRARFCLLQDVKITFQLQKDQKNLLLKYTNNHLTYVAQSFSLPLSLSVCVRVFFFCKTSVKIGYFGLAPLASVNSVYLALWCVFRSLIKLLVLNKVLSFPPLDTVAVQILHCALLLSSSFILK